MTLHTPEECKAELEKRLNAEAHILPYIEYTHSKWVTSKYHATICEHLEALERGDIDKLIINAPRRHSKSEIASRRFPSWAMGRHPDWQIGVASYGDTIAEDLSRNVRNIMQDPYYHAVFEDVALSKETTAAGRWETTAGGIFTATGIGGPLTGRGMDLGIIDDPHKDRQEADSPRMREIVWQWYNAVFIGCLQPGARQLVMMCMTGDTPVLMANGAENPLRHIRPGDMVATYENGRISTARVDNWRSSGLDSVFEIRTSRGNVVKANQRHPFLVEREGRQQWVRLRDMRPGERILRVTGESGEGSHALFSDAPSRQYARGCALRTTTRPGGPPGLGHRAATQDQIAALVSSIGTALLWMSTRRCVENRVVSVPYVDAYRLRLIQGLTGAGCYASTIATRQGRSAGFSATTAILPLDTGKQRGFYCGLPPTYEITTDTIVEIRSVGVEEVFDVEIERTGNFIASGLVSHNTRWHEDDLVGRLIAMNDNWELLNLPIIANSGTDHEEALSPERYPIEVVTKKRETLRKAGRMREWNAQYMGNPTPEEGTYIKREWLAKRWVDRPKEMHVYMACDFAVTDAMDARDPDWTVFGVFGIDDQSRLLALDWWRGKTSPDVWFDVLIDMVSKWKPMDVCAGKGIIRRALEKPLLARCNERRTWFNIVWIDEMVDKAVKGRAFQARASMGNVLFPMEPWAEEVIEQIIGFPTIKHDDDFDVMAIMCLHLDEAPAPMRKVDVEPEHHDRWKTSKSQGSAERWKTL